MLSRSFLALSLLLSLGQTGLYGMELTTLSRNQIHAPSALGDIEVVADTHDFFVKKNGILNRVQRHDIDRTLKTAHKQLALQKLLKNSYVSVSRYDNGDYKLNVHGRINGGGPITSYALYLATKTLCYSTAVAAATAATSAVIASGGVAAPVVAASVSLATGGAGAAAGAIGAAAATSTVVAAVATEATVATVTAAGGFAAAAAAVETASLAAAAFGMWLPLP